MGNNKLVKFNENDKLSFINTWFGFITFILLIITTIVSIVASTVGATANIEKNSESINQLTISISNIDEKTETNENRINVIETHYVHIKDQLDRIELKLSEK